MHSILIGQGKQAVQLSDYIGYYLFKGAETRPFPGFSQLEIRAPEPSDERGQVRGRILFYADPNNSAADTSVVCWCSILQISEDSLYFRTEECLNEFYEFSGRWLLKPTEFVGEDYPFVLDGIMAHYVRGRLMTRKRISFFYSEGC
jgi:hypothetical protein